MLRLRLAWVHSTSISGTPYSQALKTCTDMYAHNMRVPCTKILLPELFFTHHFLMFYNRPLKRVKCSRGQAYTRTWRPISRSISMHACTPGAVCREAMHGVPCP
eukprot:2442031-Pleurochrysis_carterae.AAC.2